MSVASPVPVIDFTDPDFDYESDMISHARETHWYAEIPHGIMVLRHDEAWAVLRDKRFVPGGKRYMHSHGIHSGPLYDWFANMIASVSQEDHDRLRPLVIRVFSPRLVESFRPFVRETADRLAEQIAETGRVCDFVSSFAEPLPALVMCRMLGVPEADYRHFHHWANEMGLTFNLSDEHLPQAETAVVELSGYVEEMLQRRRENLTDDLVSKLIRACDAGELSHSELHNLVLTLVWAAQDTTARQLGRALVAFSRHPDQWMALREEPALIDQAVEEVCRWTPQARATFRFATEEVQLKERLIPAGSMVVICIVAANRDPRAYDQADRFDIRADRDARQLVFGGGPHMCLGSGAARLELSEGVAALVRRFGPPSITGPVTWSPKTAMIHGPHRLPLAFGDC